MYKFLILVLPECKDKVDVDDKITYFLTFIMFDKLLHSRFIEFYINSISFVD